MHSKYAAWFSALVAPTLILSGCSSGGGELGASFYVEACSLGCSNGQTGAQVTCAVVSIGENQEIALLFSSPVNLNSVTKESFQVKNSVTGAAAAGSRFIDPLNPNRLVFRPKLTVDSVGNTVFGFEEGVSYEVHLNGTKQNDPVPFVENTQGRPNEARVQCTVTANQGIVDPIPGKPAAKLLVDTVDPSNGSVSTVEISQAVTPGAINVKTFSVATLVFDELMDISTLVNPSTGQSPTISVEVDVDGDLATVLDRTPVDGTFAYSFDQIAQTTTIVFTPLSGFPSPGSNPTQPRLVLITLDAGISDIAANTLDNPGSYNFIAQGVGFGVVTIPTGGEQFDDLSNLDPEISGADWGTVTPSRLTPGEGGGSGRLGELRVLAGQTLVLHSTPQSASATIKFLSNPANNDEVLLGGVTFVFKTVPTTPLHIATRADLAYAVATLRDGIAAYATANPTSKVAEAVYTQAAYDTLLISTVTAGVPAGPFTVAVDPPTLATLSSSILTGGFGFETYVSPNTITNFNFDPTTGGTAGGIPPDVEVSDGVYEFTNVSIAATGQLVLAGDLPVQILARGDFTLPELAVIDLSGQNAPNHRSSAPYGQPGCIAGPGGGDGGRGGDRSNQPTMNTPAIGGVTLANSVLTGSDAQGVGGMSGLGEGRGRGGVNWPTNFPTDLTVYNDFAIVDLFCSSYQIGGPGSGGAYAVNGIRGIPRSTQATGLNSVGATVTNVPPFTTTAGQAGEIGLEPPSSNPTEERLLSPGEDYLRGGAGGGGGGSHLKATETQVFTNCFSTPFGLFTDHSAAAGGGGGGALQIQAGRNATIRGQIDASGGSGGNWDSSGASVAQQSASPGGGGAGGAILVQGGQLTLSTSPSRFLIPGGAGGVGGDSLLFSLAGAGSPGLLRVEERGPGNGPSATAVAAITFPTDPLDPTSVKWLSTGDWIFDEDKVSPAEAVSGAQSCWMRPTGNFFSLTFLDDPAGPTAPEAMGWNMDVILDLGSGEEVVPYRGSDGNGPFLGLYPEEHWGTLLNRDLQVGEVAAPIVVRFQGAASKSTLLEPCNVNPNSPSGPIKIGSLSPWVRHPNELNSFLPLPDLSRFVILFDRSHPDFGLIRGVTNLRITAQPE
jgi:hypothetical protein